MPLKQALSRRGMTEMVPFLNLYIDPPYTVRRNNNSFLRYKRYNEHIFSLLSKLAGRSRDGC